MGNNGDGKIIQPEPPKDDGTVLVVSINNSGQITWTTKMPPPQLNFILDTIKNHLFKPKDTRVVSAPGSFMNRIKNSGAFGKKK